MNYIYPAIITKLAENDYNVTFPNFKNIITYGENLESAYSMAEDALSLELSDLYKNNKEIPKAIDFDKIKVAEHQTLISLKVKLENK